MWCVVPHISLHIKFYYKCIFLVWKNVPNEEHWVVFDVEMIKVEPWSPELQFKFMDTNKSKSMELLTFIISVRVHDLNFTDSGRDGRCWGSGWWWWWWGCRAHRIIIIVTHSNSNGRIIWCKSQNRFISHGDDVEQIAIIQWWSLLSLRVWTVQNL